MPLEVAVKPALPLLAGAFASEAAPLFANSDRFAAEVTEYGLSLSCIWRPDLDEAWNLLASKFSYELSWSEPKILYRYETVTLPSGQRRDIVLEPILRVEVRTPEDFSGTVMGDLSARRGMITGMADDDRGWKVIAAEVPLFELSQYSEILNRLTNGTAVAHADFLNYQERPKFVDPDPDEPMSAALRA